MTDIAKYTGKQVSIVCRDGRRFFNYRVTDGSTGERICILPVYGEQKEICLPVSEAAEITVLTTE